MSDEIIAALTGANAPGQKIQTVLMEYLCFRFEGNVRAYSKTQRWSIVSNFTSEIIGEIRWRAQWRRYVCAPGPSTEFDAGCLKEIAAFCAFVTAERKTHWKKVN